MTKALFKFFYIICFVVIAVFVSKNVLLPFVYKLKEPFFIMPIETKNEIPIRNDDYGDGYFGAKRRGGRIHKGLDLAAKLKSPVYASKSGWAKTYTIPAGYGKLVIINHPGGWQTRYGHLDSFSIKKSQWVSQGSIIGFVGKSGNANTKGLIPHVHFEIRQNDEPQDPAVALSRISSSSGGGK
ncbi:MAG: M23 family metallopeptidase [Candidatus Omnitrophota bacterium]